MNNWLSAHHHDRSLRNASKKLASRFEYFPKLLANLKQNSIAKVDAILASNSGTPLDTLVAEKKINPDQKAQVLKKPALQASVAQLEEQIGQYKGFAVSVEEHFAHEKASLEKAHRDELEAVRGKAVAETTERIKKEFEDQLLSLTKFLATAAAMRHAGESGSNENRAFEGVLYQLYGGSRDAVVSMLKLAAGADEQVTSVEGELLDITCTPFSILWCVQTKLICSFRWQGEAGL